MNSAEKIRDAQAQIAGAVGRRYEARKPLRDARLAVAFEKGPLAAAPRSEAVGRAAHLTVAEGRNLEATTGNYDIEQVNFLSRGLKASRAVCRITSGGTSWGTGFLVAPGLLMTNCHVLPDLESAKGCVAEFGFEYDSEDQVLPVETFPLEPDRLFICSPDDALDFTLVGISEHSGALAAMGWLPLNPIENKIVEGEPAVIIQHPGQEDKKICLFDSILVDRNPDVALPYLYYTTDTERGASGSPVFNRNWQVVALHHGSVPIEEIDRVSGKTRKVVANEGIRISRLVAALTTGNQIAIGSAEQRSTARQLLLAPQVQGNSRPQGPALGLRQAELTARKTRSPDAIEFERAGSRTIIRTPPVAHYRGRKGYDDDFLGVNVPLPTLSSALEDDVAPLLASRSSYILKYTHYSIAICASRRTAYFSAVNIDGATNPVTFDRKRRIEFESTIGARILERAADVWYYDPRMAQEYQIGPEVFDDPNTKFDFGHITRRMDAVWGDDDDEKLLGSDDTFHMTNCSPQVSEYNQHGDWGNLENAVAAFARGNARNAPRKITVISGPVLHPADPEILGVQVPLAFWKVVAFVDDEGELRSLGFITSQSELVDDEARKLETARTLVSKAFDRGWLTTIRDISRLTSLDFGSLVNSDYFAGSGGRRVAITERLINDLFPT
jgi:endonuclease G, mitochondrial